jgi:hypothetical protein
MPFAPAAPPQPLAVDGPIAALAVDAPRRRAFAAGPNAVVVIDADTGKRLATIRIEGTRSLAVEPLGGHIFVATNDGRISELDPDRLTVVRSVDAGAPARALLDDSASGRLYAAVPGALAVVDTVTFGALAAVPLAGGLPDALAADPVTGELYVAFADRPGIAVVDPRRGAVRAILATAGAGNAAVAFDAALGELVAVASAGVTAVYDRAGTPLGSFALTAPPLACDLDAEEHRLVCADSGGLTFARLERGGAPADDGRVPLGGRPRAAFDARTHAALAVTGAPGGAAAVQLLRPAE